ncbi:hypothetical protein OIU78_014139 [Salix suchowensis]|nr:hypothetical protein OIU78_014139 [Salix suchowensis]
MRSFVNANDPYGALRFYYEKMIAKWVLPNHYTFPLVAKVCADIGSLRGAQKVHALVVKFGFELDLFVRNSFIRCYSVCGRTSDARMVFDNGFVLDLVRVEPTLWGDLLSACRAHCISEPGEILAKQLIKLFPNHVVPYLLLSNAYATEGRWDDLENLRMTLKNKTLNSKMVFTSRRHSMLSEAAAQIKFSNIDSIRT